MRLVLVHDDEKVVSVSFFLVYHFHFVMHGIGMLVMYGDFCVLFHL